MNLAEAPTQQRQALGFLLLLSLTHGVVDLGAGALIGWLPFLREHYNLSYTMVGSIVLAQSLTSSITQPFFGMVSDRTRHRWLLPLSLVFSGIGVAATGWMPNYGLMLVAVIMAALGVAAFHPEGAHAAHHLAGGRKARAMAIYGVGGNIGYAMGTVYGAALIGLGGGMRGTGWGLVLPGLLAVWLYTLLPRWQQAEQANAPRKVRPEDLPANNWSGAILLTVLVIIRNVINQGVATYVPFFWIDILGNAAATGPYVQLTYLLSGVLGTLLAAPWADRIGTKRFLVVSFVLLLPLQAALPWLSGWSLLVVLFLSGATLVSSFSVTLVMIQEYMPRSLGMASGINLGIAFGLAGVGTQILGLVADRWSVLTAMQTVAALVPILIVLSLTLPPVQRR